MAPCVGFDDAAEIAWCASQWSIAHPPGFPAYFLLAHGWLWIWAPIGLAHALGLLSAVLAAAAILLSFRTALALLSRTGRWQPAACSWAAFTAALGMGAGTTLWQYGHAIEVYALQGFCTTLLVWSVCPTGSTLSRTRLVLAGVAAGVGLANHHLTMILLLPFVVVLATGLRVRISVRAWLAAGAVAAGIATTAYLLMMLRAGGTYAFEFGNPDTLGRLWHHVSGGFYGKGVGAAGHAGQRALFFSSQFLLDSWIFTVPMLLGFHQSWRWCRPLPIAILGYAACVFLVQVSRDQVPNMDAYFVPALLLLSVPTAFGLAWLIRRPAHAAVAVAAVAVMAAINFNGCDRSRYDVGDSLHADFFGTAPRDAIVLVTSWELWTLHRLHADVYGHRKDLVVLRSDLKGTNRDSLAIAYPDLLAAVHAEYEAYMAAVAEVDPDYVYTDYFEIGTRRQADAYRGLVEKVIQVARAGNRPLLMDWRTVSFLGRNRLVRGEQVEPCGNLFSLGPVPDAAPFQSTGTWPEQPCLVQDLGAWVTIQAYLKISGQVMGYYGARGERERRDAVQEIHERWRRIHAGYFAGKGFIDHGW